METIMQPSLITWKAGDKVECVETCEATCCHMRGIAPVKGQTFTIAGFENTCMGEAGIHLVEVKVEPCNSYGFSVGPITVINLGGPPPSVSWPIVRFRKLIEDKEEKTDHVEALKKMARDMPAPSIAPKVPEN